MPIFEYRCRQCGHDFERIVTGSDTPGCPACHAPTVEKRLSAFAVGRTDGMAASGACGTCGDPRGPGACAMD